MSIRGSLNDVPLANIVQLVSESGKTGAFVLQSDSQIGEIYLRDGMIVHARLGRQVGEEAVCEIAVWQEGSFIFKEHKTSPEHSIERSTTGLLLEAARRIDEWQLLSKRFPSTRVVPRLSDKDWTTSISFSAQEWSVICRIDQKRTIDDIAQSLGLGALEVCKTLYGLVAKGLVELG